MDFRVDESNVMKFRDRVRVLNFLELNKRILEEGHKNRLRIHPNATKMYQNLMKMFWWP